jgi:hypothetical protein
VADQLITPGELASLLERDDLDAAKATMLVEVSTSIVQEAAGGQRIIQVVDDTVNLVGTSDSWLALPQIPVSAVASVTLDGTVLVANTDYQVFGDRIWRAQGWQSLVGAPSLVAVVYTHGYVFTAQACQLARSAVLSVCAGAYTNPAGLKSVGVDDYHVVYSALAREMELTPYLAAALKRQYGRRAGLVRIT